MKAMENESFQNPFVQKMKTLTNILIVSVGVNVAFGGTLIYHFCIKDITPMVHLELPEVALRKEHGDLLHSFFEMRFEELVLELSNTAEISDGYKICDLVLAILSTYHYLDLSKALMGENLEVREVMFLHTDGGESFPLSLYPDVKDYQYELIKGYIKENTYPFTAEGLFAELKIQKEASPTELVAAFMLSKEFIAIYTFVNRFFDNLPKEKLLLTLIAGTYKDIERFYYLYLENMDKPKEMIRYFLKTYCRYESRYAAEMWIDIVEHYILHQLTDEEIINIVKLTDRESFLQKIQSGVRNYGIRETAERKLPMDELVKIPTKNETTQFISYVVKEGDSFWKIAHNHKVSVDAIKRANNLHSDLLKPGQKITIPRN